MQNLGFTGLIVAYAVLPLLLLSLYLHSSWNWWIKAGATALVALLYMVTYVSIPPLMGWPTTHDIPKQFRLIAYSVDEEGKAIHIWANDLHYGVRLAKPRAYTLPYSRKLAENVEIAGAKIRRGGSIIGEVEYATPAKMPRNATNENLSSTKMKVNFIDAPEALIPENH